MNGFQALLMNHYFPQGQTQAPQMSSQPPMMMGGNQPPMQGNGGINPGGMYTGGNLPAQTMPPVMGGNLPPQQMGGYPGMHMGGPMHPMQFHRPRPFHFFGRAPGGY